MFSRSLVATLLSILSIGCGPSFTADLTSEVIEIAGPSFNEHWDYEFAGEAAPGNIMQLEGFHRASPGNEIITMELAKAYTGYAFGWIEDEADRAEDDDFERADQLRVRARWMYIRARELSKRVVRDRHEGLDAALAGGIENFEQYLTNFTDTEDAEALFWTGYAWGSAINVSREDPAMTIGLPFAKALIERSVALDPTYFNAGGLTFLAVVASDFPPALGGDPEAGRALFERALEITGRRFLIIQLNYAASYCVQTQDEDLFMQLTQEIEDAGDIYPEQRLPNKIAKRRARWLRARAADELF